MYWSWLLSAMGIVGLWLAGSKNKNGWIISLLAQFLWIAYAVQTKQYGFIVSALAYGAVYARNFKNWSKS